MPLRGKLSDHWSMEKVSFPASFSWPSTGSFNGVLPSALGTPASSFGLNVAENDDLVEPTAPGDGRGLAGLELIAGFRKEDLHRPPPPLQLRMTPMSSLSGVE